MDYRFVCSCRQREYDKNTSTLSVLCAQFYKYTNATIHDTHERQMRTLMEDGPSTPTSMTTAEVFRASCNDIDFFTLSR